MKELWERQDYYELMARPKVESWLTILNTYKAIFNHLDMRLQEQGCSISRFQILINLKLQDDVTPVKLAKRMQVSRANMSTFLKRLINDGLVKTQISANSKRPTYLLSSKGEKYLANIFPRHIEDVETIMEVFDKKDLVKLKKIVDKCSKDRDVE